MFSICSLGPQTRSFPIKVRVICVPGRYDICISIGINMNILIVFMIDILISVSLLGSDFFSRSLISKKEQSSQFHCFHCKSCPWFHSLSSPQTTSTTSFQAGVNDGIKERRQEPLGKSRCHPSNGSTTSIRVEFNTTNPMVPFQKMAQILWEKPHGFRVQLASPPMDRIFPIHHDGKAKTRTSNSKFMCAKVSTPYIGDGHPPFIGYPYNGHINPYYWVDDHSLLYGNTGSLDYPTHVAAKKSKRVEHHLGNSQLHKNAIQKSRLTDHHFFLDKWYCCLPMAFISSQQKLEV